MEEKRQDKVQNRMSDAEYRLNRELLEAIRNNPENFKTQTSLNNKIF